MSGRPQPSSSAPPPAASSGKPTTPQQPSAAISPSLAALRGAGAPPKKNFGPPTMQLASDTVVFQAAKIPVSSSRLSSAPGTAGLAAAVTSGGGGRGSYAPREIDPRRGGGYTEPPGHGAHPMNRSTAYDRPLSPSRLYTGERGAQRTSLSESHASSPHSGLPVPPQQLRGMPRSLPPPMARERVQGREHNQRSMMATMNGTRDPTSLQQNDASGGYSADRGEGEFTHLLMEEDASVATRPRPSMESVTRPPTVTQRQQRRPSSADKNKADRNLVRLTVRVMKDGDKLGFGIRNDSNRKLKVSTLQTNSTAAKSTLKIGDTILSVNGIDLRDMGFLEVIQQLKATKPGELVFDIERSLKEEDDEASLSGAEGSLQGETMDLDSPLSVAEKRFGPAATQSSPGAPLQQQQQQPPQQLPLPPPPRRSESTPMAQTAHRNAATPLAPPVSLVQQRGPLKPQQDRLPTGVGMHIGPGTGSERNLPQQQHSGHMGELYGPRGPIEPPRKRPRPEALTPAQVEMELARMDKQHRHVLNTLSLELKKERTEKLGLEEKNAALRKRLQNMLIECDEVRVKASSTVATIKEHAQRDIHELRQALQSARAQLRLQDRGPDVGRTDSIVNDLHATKDQLNRLRKVEMERATNLSNRYSLESRQAEREASRTRDRLVQMFTGQLRDVARRNYNNTGVRNQGGNDKSKKFSSIVVHYEGLRRLAFVKLFGLPCSYEWYNSDEFYSTTLVRHALPKQDDIMDIFGNALCHEERAGLFIVASAPMNLAYDPTIEKLTLSCSWAEQNQLRELARNFRF